MDNWIEFKYIRNDEINKCAVKLYNIGEVEAISSDTCKVYCDDHEHFWKIAESYDEVMTKIKKAEEPVCIPVAEHFTREEYKFIFNTLDSLMTAEQLSGSEKIEAKALIKKLEEILGE